MTKCVCRQTNRFHNQQEKKNSDNKFLKSQIEPKRFKASSLKSLIVVNLCLHGTVSTLSTFSLQGTETN